MSFKSEYAKLEEKCEAKCKNDNPHSIFLPNIEPSGKVDYVFIGTEPSLEDWTRRQKTMKEKEEEAKRKRKAGFKNFVWSERDFIIRFCINKFLGNSYYITDLSKGAMLNEDANRNYEARYERWFPLSIEELKLVTHNSSKIILIGKKHDNFFEKRIDRINNETIKNMIKNRKKISQHSLVNSNEIKKIFDKEKLKFTDVNEKDIINFAIDFLKKWNMQDDLREEIIVNVRNKLQNFNNNTKIRQKLISVYKFQLEKIKNS
jgi:hypothetical protein